MRIITLDPLLANQLAAGEVVERPASALKELLENSIDAGATKILVELEGGGIKRLLVSDNGCGIVKEDLPLAFSRHATSKIDSIDSLEKVSSLGFRGEALASISAVSRVRLVSATSDQSTGWEIRVEGRVENVKLSPCAHPVGTTIEVNDLFFNTPARRKFLRTERTELAQIEEVLRRMLLSRFNIQFLVKHQGKILFNAPIAVTRRDQERRVSEVFGTDFVTQSIAIEAKTFEFSLSGWISLPQYSRSQRDKQYFYVNGRIVKDKLINHAISQAYQDVLYNHRYPGYILYFSLPHELVDVNVHPTKHEVRFRDRRLVYDFITRTLKESLENIRPQHVIQKLSSSPSYVESIAFQRPLEIQEPQTDLMLSVAPQSTASTAEPVPVETLPNFPSLGYALAQLHGVYLIAQNEQGMVLVDIHAAHERVLYEKLKNQYHSQTIMTQQLLVPLTVPLSRNEADFVEDQSAYFNRLGFDLERLSHETIVVRQIPALLQTANLSQLIIDIIADQKIFGESARLQNCENEILGNIACKAAVRANTLISIEQMNHLLRAIETTPNSGVCNHGRPTWQSLTLQDLDKIFLRGR